MKNENLHSATLFSLFMMLICSFVLVSCGVKPGSVKPPEGSEYNFPGTYPNPNTDAQP